MTAEEELIEEHDRLRSEFITAKQMRLWDEDAYQAAKKAFSEFRTYWRNIRDAMTEGGGYGDHRVDVVRSDVGEDAD